MDDNTLPPMPEPVNPIRLDSDGEYREACEYEDHFAADQMRSFALAAQAMERERCAKLCDGMVLYTGFDCAAAIRAGSEG